MRDDELDELLGKGQPGDELSPTDAPLDEGLLLAYRAGTLPEAEAEALELRLARDPEARALLRELSQDVSEHDVERIVRAAQPSNVIPLFRRGRAVAVVAASLAAAAGVAFVVTRPPPVGARYVLEVEGGTSPTRGAAPAALELKGESRLIVRLRADVPTDERRSLACYVEDGERHLRRLRCEVEQQRGSFEARLTRASFEGAGVYRMWIVVQRGADEPDPFAGRTQAEVSTEGLSWHPLDLEVRAE